jgi:hypothetical protein
VMKQPMTALDIFYGPMPWSEKAWRLEALAEINSAEHVQRYLARARPADKFTWEAGDLELLQPEGEWTPLGEAGNSRTD